jgi:hypothetical protein
MQKISLLHGARSLGANFLRVYFRPRFREGPTSFKFPDLAVRMTSWVRSESSDTAGRLGGWLFLPTLWAFAVNVD